MYLISVKKINAKESCGSAKTRYAFITEMSRWLGPRLWQVATGVNGMVESSADWKEVAVY